MALSIPQTSLRNLLLCLLLCLAWLPPLCAEEAMPPIVPDREKLGSLEQIAAGLPRSSPVNAVTVSPDGRWLIFRACARQTLKITKRHGINRHISPSKRGI